MRCRIRIVCNRAILLGSRSILRARKRESKSNRRNSRRRREANCSGIIGCFMFFIGGMGTFLWLFNVGQWYSITIKLWIHSAWLIGCGALIYFGMHLIATAIHS